MAIRLRNTSKEAFVDRFNGEEYVIGPGEVAVVPNGAAALWLGVNERGVVSDDERRRCAFRRNGKYPPLVLATKEAPASTQAATRTYTCEECGEVFDHHMRLKAHMKNEHGPTDDVPDDEDDLDE